MPAAWLIANAVSTHASLKSLRLTRKSATHSDSGKVSSQHPAADTEKAKAHEALRVDALENFPLFAAAMIVGNDAGLEAGTLNAVGLGYLLTRGVYSWLYCTAAKEANGYIRYFQSSVC